MSDINRIAQAFQPGDGTSSFTTGLVPSAAAQNLALQTGLTSAGVKDVPTQFDVTNTSTVAIAIRFSVGAATAVAASFGTNPTPGDSVVLPGARRTLSIPGNPTNCSIIGTGAGTTACYVTPGYGSN